MGVFVGVDVSKQHLDWVLGVEAEPKRVPNGTAGIRRLVKNLSKAEGITSIIVEVMPSGFQSPPANGSAFSGVRQPGTATANASVRAILARPVLAQRNHARCNASYDQLMVELQ